jgi:hypothetical protein
MKNEPLLITPQTKVLQLIETYPQLEDVLIGYVPAFKKLKNPVLRRTVAKIATLQQAANVGNVPIGDLINLLRAEVGQELLSDEVADHTYNTVKPEWFDEQKINQEFDVREMLESGEQPVHQVMADLNKLPKGTIYQLTAPFLPAPLIDKATSLKLTHWVLKQHDELVVVYFYKDHD